MWRGLELSFDDRVRGDVIQQLMCNAAVDVAVIERRHDIDFREYFAASLERLEPLVQNGLVEFDGQRVDRTIVSATSLEPFGSKRFEIDVPAAAKWVRFAAWDVAGNGALAQPVKLP